MSTRLLVTGMRGAGKTVFCRALAGAAAVAGADPAGLISPRVYEGETQVAIDALDLRTGERRRLAVLRAPDEAPESEATRLWRFQPGTLAWGDGVLRRAVPCGLLVVDELGPLELSEGRGWAGGLVAVDSRAFRAAVVVVRPALLGEAQGRWPDAEVIDLGRGPAPDPAALARSLLER